MIRVFRVLVPASLLALLCFDIVLIFAAYGAVAYYELDGDLFLFSASGWQPIALVEVLILLGMYFRHLYSDLRVLSWTMLLQQLSLIFGLTFITEALMSYWSLEWALPRNTLIEGSALALVALLLGRVLFSLAIRNKVGVRRVLFVGFSPTAMQLAGHLGLHPEFGLTPIGYLDPPDAEARPESGLPWLGSAAELPEVVDQYHPEWIVVGRQEEIQPRWVDDFLELRFGGVHTEPAGQLYESAMGRVCASEIKPAELIFSQAFAPDAFNARLQPFYSLATAFVAGCIAAPFAAIIALLVKVTSRGPVLAPETRIGLNGAPFRLLRFRCCTLDGQPTGIGNLLRHLGVDGLPQLVNILRGDMVLVGPYPDRPEVAERLLELIPFHEQRNVVKPGVTGWAQVHDFGDDSDLDAVCRLEYDLYYVKNMSMSLDLSVVLRWLREAFVSRVFAND